MRIVVTLTGCRSQCCWAPASPSRWNSVDSLSLDKVCAPAESVPATAWTAQTAWTSRPRSDPTTAETLREEQSSVLQACRAYGLIYERVMRFFFYLHSFQVSCSVSQWMGLHLYSSVSPQPVCFHSRGDTALSPPSETGTGSTSWWSLWCCSTYRQFMEVH